MTQDKRKLIKKQKLRFLRHQLYWLCWTWQDYKGLFSSEANFELMIRISMLDSTIFNEDAEVAEWPTVDEIEGVVHPERDRLEVLTVLVDDYQARRHPISSPDPIAAIEFVLEQQGLSRKDLEDVIGSSGRISEVMNKQRPLTLAMIRKTPRVRARGRSFVVTRAKRVKARGREPQVANALHQLVHLLLTFEASGFAD